MDSKKNIKRAADKLMKDNRDKYNIYLKSLE
jgi:hypothetical protein